MAPASVQHRLGHSGFNEFLATDVTDNNECVVLRQPGGELVLLIVAAVLDLGMYRPDPLFVPGALGNAQPGFQGAVLTASQPR